MRTLGTSRVTMHEASVPLKFLRKTASSHLCVYACVDECVKKYMRALASRMELEDYNKAAVIMDVDGNGWSDRLSRIVHYPSPILKQVGWP